MPPVTQQDEFGAGAGEWPNELSRRRFLQLMAASIALAGGSSCTRQPPEKIVPYLRQPEEIVPGKPLYYATALTLSGLARGVLVETHEGRPTKIEGNPQHPWSLGATDVFMQAELLTLFDPDRQTTVTHNGQISTWESLLGDLARHAATWKRNGGAGLRILTDSDSSPTSMDQLRRLLRKYPAAKWHVYDPLQSTAEPAIYHFDRAEVIVSLGSDFLCCGSTAIRYSRDFAAKRRSTAGHRLYVAESTPSLTGAMADHCWVLDPQAIEQFALDLLSPKGGIASAVVADLRAHSGRGLVAAGDFEHPGVHDAARRLNQLFGNVGQTVDYPPGVWGQARTLDELVRDLASGSVETLVMIGGNPVWTGPVDLNLREQLQRVPNTIHLGLYPDESAVACHWHVPEAHPLESWSDACAVDGTATIVQPVIEPLFGGRSRHELFSALLEEAPTTSYDVVRSFWQTQLSGPDFERQWRKALHEGVVSGWRPQVAGRAKAQATLAPVKANGLQVLFRPSARVLDGRYGNNAWLQELPDPITKMVWDNAALVSQSAATRLGLANGDVISLKLRGQTVSGPVWIIPGQADDCVTVHLGYGRTAAGSVGNGVGFNGYALRTAAGGMWIASGVEMEKTGRRHDLIVTQHHWDMENRELVRVVNKADSDPERQQTFGESERAPRQDETLYPAVEYNGHAWGMVIDLSSCIGCATCTIACQAENNIPVVGKEQVAMNREMHWIRVDRYYTSDAGQGGPVHQPVPCMHCETAPCELVCPVAATVHSSEGLNQMVYNRCIGTRYCSNNCPYKVRRFNFLEYDANRFEQPITRKLMRNPNVTVRSRGVMEKCTYCIQRINAVKIDAAKANRVIRDGEIVPACAQACPTEAITFGDLNDTSSRVAKLRRSPLNYGLLAELNTRPRTTYLAKLQNPNPETKAST